MQKPLGTRLHGGNMRALTLQETAAAMGGRVYGRIEIPNVKGVCIDSRDPDPKGPGSQGLFIAIRGERFDGHDYVESVLEDWAAAAVVDDVNRIHKRFRSTGRLIEVDDTVQALGRLATWYRRRFSAQVIAVLGSNGKTTTKDLIAAVLKSNKRGRAAKASFNNAIGVPLTLLSVEPSDEFVVVEIGGNRPGEIGELARIAQPDMAVVTSIAEEHLAGFGDLAGVAREEFSFLSAMRGPPDPLCGPFVAINEQAVPLAPQGLLRNTTLLTYGLDRRADLRAEDLEQTAEEQRFRVNGRFEYRLPLMGRHNVLNALAAVAIGTRFRLGHEAIADALRDAEPLPMRLQPIKYGSVTLINDAYNSNPASCRAAFDALDQAPTIGRIGVVCVVD
ncbi:MAG: UDP-N-acetylmuramoyl-tripeptide--D-alanyl-D-alanine ligase, partial [Phycisphaerae bacterium]